MHTLRGLNRSVSQAQICEKKRGRSHGPSMGNQVGDGVLVAASANPKSLRRSRFFVNVRVDPKTGEPIRDRSR
jgi:hypothetical protein